jgi:lactoylglutathione lyase
MRLGYTALFVSDVMATVDFYERAFGLRRRYLHPTSEYAEMETGATLLAFTGEKLIAEMRLIGDLEVRHNRPERNPIAAQIAFVSEDVAGDYRHAVEAGAVAVTIPTAMPWGQTVGYIRDLNGVLVEICSPSIR